MVGVLIEVPVMLMFVSVCKRTCYSFEECHLDLHWCKGRDVFYKVEIWLS